MVLDYRRENLDGLSDAEKQHYQEKNGVFFLAVNDAAEERTAGLIKAKNEALAEKKALEAKLKAFEGIDPTKAKENNERLQKLEADLAAAKARGAKTEDIEQLKKDLKAEFDKQLQEKEKTIANLQNTFTQAAKNEAIKTALRKHGVREQAVDMLNSYLSGRIEAVTGDTGQISVRVKKVDGEGFEVSTRDGSVYKSVDELVTEMKTDKNFSFVFDGTRASGTGTDAKAANSGGNMSAGKFSGKWASVQARSDLATDAEKAEFISYLRESNDGSDEKAMEAYFAIPAERPNKG